MAAPQSQLSSQALDPEWVTIPLEKFSYAVSPPEARAHQWVHDSRRDDLFLVFRPERLLHENGTHEKITLMSVLAGGDILERQNADALAAIAEDFKNGVQRGLLDPSLEAPVHVVIKSPCIAVRYPLSSASVRRIQMKFQNDSDYETAVNIFRQRHFPVRNAGGKSNFIDSLKTMRSASATTAQSSSVYNSQGTSTSRLLPTYQGPGEKGTAYGVSGQGSFEEPRLFKEPPTASSDSVRPGSAWSMSSAKKSETASSTTLGPYWPSHFSKRADFVTTNTPGLALSSDPPSLIQELQSQNASHSRSRTADPFGPPLITIQDSHRVVGYPARCEDAAPFRRTTSTHENSRFSRHSNSSQPDRRSSFVPEFLRPGSAPVLESQHHFSQWIPPRRELPFSKARMTTKSCTTADDTSPLAQSTSPNHAPDITKAIENKTSHKSTLTQSTQQLTPHKDTSVLATSQAYSIASIPDHYVEKGESKSGRPVGVENVVELSPLAPKGTAVAKSSIVPDLLSKTAVATSRKRANEALMESAPSSRPAKKMVDRSTQTQTLSGRDHTAAHVLNSEAQRTISTVIDETRTQPPPQDFMHELESFITKHKNRPPPREIWERPGYTDATSEQRQAIINDFICENLDNEEFLKLCEDTAEVWRRIGLEL